ncbi:MAG TPA: Lrp/AsnC family transcriptional regulator [Archaeoglobaceae archaeon]|nr:Lrp/AsnC family transcriptional regulator [Archaeoglobaceae archaeon]
MTTAYILVNTDTGQEYSVYDEIKALKGVVEVNIVYGVYDIVVKVKTEDNDELRRLIEFVRKISGIRSTLTLIAI